ncbi:MAG: DinB family protein, partial [Acidobacteriota bacterium]
MEKIVVASKTVSSVSAGRGRKLTPPLQGAPLEAYLEVRSQTETLARPITSEDAQVQTMRDVSPTKWHLGHTSWFFETFLLEERAGYQRAVPEFRVLFNSYYNTVGPQHPRPRRGFLTRPLLSEVYEYRRRVDAGIIRLTEEALEPEVERLAGL